MDNLKGSIKLKHHQIAFIIIQKAKKLFKLQFAFPSYEREEDDREEDEREENDREENEREENEKQIF